MCVVCSKDTTLPRINESTSPTFTTSPTLEEEVTITTSTCKDDSHAGKDESTPLLDSRKDHDRSSYGESTVDHEEHVTFADIPMPGLWEEDKPGRNTDRIIILLFVLLASMIVVSPCTINFINVMLTFHVIMIKYGCKGK